MKIDTSNMENFVVLNIAGGFLHNLNYVDDPIFFEAINGTIGGEYGDGTPIAEDEMIHSKVPMTITGYALIDKTGNFGGFVCFESQIQAEGLESGEEEDDL